MGGNTQNLYPGGSLNNIQAAQLVGEFLSSTKCNYLCCLGEGPSESCKFQELPSTYESCLLPDP